MGKKNRDNHERWRAKANHPFTVRTAVLAAGYLVWVGLMYYLLLPAWNIHSMGMWLFLILFCGVPAGLIYAICTRTGEGKGATFHLAGFAPSAIALLLFGIAWMFGAKMFHASAYASLLTTEEYQFTEDIDQSQALNKIALMDTDSAILLGDREIGGLSDVVSQYDVSEYYSQIDLKGAPIKVSALDYAGFFKYMGNQNRGIPGYVRVDPVGQNAEYIALQNGMKYVPSAYFFENLTRHLRIKFPTKIFGNLHFEVDEDGKPYYLASVYKYTVGLFGGETVAGVIVCDPVNGEAEYYPVNEIPKWIDIVFDGDLLVEQYDLNGMLSNGFWNSVLGKKGCRRTTKTIVYDEDDEEDEENVSYQADYGYVAKDGDIWIYTGVTSVNDDASNIGFILVNERTQEAHYYAVAGADESSAMAAAEGEVQEKGYQASFPSLINVDSQPTYVMVLKDAHGIVKLYAMVNVESYNKVTTAASLEDCYMNYRRLIKTEGDEPEENKDADAERIVTTTILTVKDIRYIDMDGNTYVYLIAEDDAVYKARFADNESLIYLQPGDKISADWTQEEDFARTLLRFTVP